MKKQNFFVFILTVFIIAILGFLVYFTRERASFIYCDPATPRGNNDQARYLKTISLQKTFPEIDHDFFNNIEITSDISNVIVKFPSTDEPAEPSYEEQFPYELREMTLDKPLEIGGGTLELGGIGVAFFDKDQEISQSAPYKFFNAKFEPEKKEIVDQLWKYEKSEDNLMFDYDPYPFVQLCLEYHEIEDMMFNGIQVFDAKTHKLLSSGYSTSKGLDKDFVKVQLPIWHQTPIDLVIDVSSGPSETFEFPPEPGKGFSYEGFECQLIDVFDNINISRHSSSSKFFKISKAISESDRKGLSILLACQPAAHQMPVTFDILDKDGQIYSGAGGSTSHFIRNIRLQQPLEKVNMIRAKYRTNRNRIIIHLPYIPGLPEQNKNIDNLFDVYIPYVKFNDAGKINSFLHRTLQLSRSSIVGNKKTNNNIKFPIVFTDVTIGDIVKQYKPGTTVNADIENDQLEIQYPLPFMKKMKKLFQRIRQK